MTIGTITRIPYPTPSRIPLSVCSSVRLSIRLCVLLPVYPFATFFTPSDTRFLLMCEHVRWVYLIFCGCVFWYLGVCIWYLRYVLSQLVAQLDDLCYLYLDFCFDIFPNPDNREIQYASIGCAFGICVCVFCIWCCEFCI